MLGISLVYSKGHILGGTVPAGCCKAARTESTVSSTDEGRNSTGGGGGKTRSVSPSAAKFYLFLLILSTAVQFHVGSHGKPAAAASLLGFSM